MVMILEDKGLGVRIKSFFSKPKNTISAAAFAVLAISIPVTAVLISQQQSMQQSAARGGNTYGAKIEEIADAVSNNTLTVSDFTTKAANDYGYLSLVCAPDFKAAEYYGTRNPTIAQKYKARGIQTANFLVAHKDDNTDGKVGWGSSSPTALDNGQTAPANTIDAYTTGLVTNCLMEAYNTTKDSKYLATVNEAFTNYLPNQVSNFDPACQNCTYLQPFLVDSMKGRKIKNRNMLLAMGLSKAAVYDRGNSFKTMVPKLLNAENYEFKTRNNYGYAGYNDEMFWYFNYPENHIEFDMWGLDEVSRSSNTTVDKAMLEGVWNKFTECGNSCMGNENSETRLFVSCQLAPYGDPFKSDCKRLIQYYSNFPNQISMLGLSGMIRANSVLANEVYSSVPSPTPTPVPNYSVVPQAPTNVRTGIITSSAIQVRWDDPGNNEKKFVVEYARSDSPTYRTVDAGQNWTSQFISGIPASTQMKIRVKACNDLGCSPTSSEIMATTNPPYGTQPTSTPSPTPTPSTPPNFSVVPSKPTNVQVTFIGSTSATLTWQTTSNNETSFGMAYTTVSPIAWKTIPGLSGSTRTYTFTGLSPLTDYYLGVAGCNSVGCSAYTTTQVVKTLGSAPTVTPTFTPSPTLTSTPTPKPPTPTPTVSGRR